MGEKKKKDAASRRLVYVMLPFVLPLCLIAVGVLMIVNESFVTRLLLVCGIVVALVGLIEVVIYCARRKYEMQPQFLVSGVILLILGALLIIVPAAVNTWIPVLVALCVLVAGVSGVSNTLAFRQEDSTIAAPIVVALLTVALGIFILIYALFINPNAGWNVIGILMIISGALRIVNEVLARIRFPKQASVRETTASDMDQEK